MEGRAEGREGGTPGEESSQRYEAPQVESVTTADDLEREALHGIITAN